MPTVSVPQNGAIKLPKKFAGKRVIFELIDDAGVCEFFTSVREARCGKKKTFASTEALIADLRAHAAD